MAQIDRLAGAAPVDSGEAAEWIRTHWISLAAVVLLATQLVWKAGLLAHFYFAEGDYPLIERAAGRTVSLSYLLKPVNGQLAPGVRALAWLQARASLYDWSLASAVTLALLALAGLALLQVLRTLFGNTPAILIPFAIYLFTPLMVPGLAWWSASLGWLPLQLAMLAATDAHLRYLRSGKVRQLAATTCWLLAGMLFAEKGVLVPLLLFALTSGFLTTGRWPGGIALTVRSHWRAWLTYALVTAGYVAVIAAQLSQAKLVPNRIPAAGAALDMASAMIRISFIPAAVGGPWRWLSVGNYALAAQVPVITAIGWALAAGIVLISLWLRKRAWRAWAIVAAWLIVADLFPVLFGWSGLTVSAVLGTDLSYLADAVPVLVICVALAFLPVAGEADAYNARRPARQTRALLTANVLVVVIGGSLWSQHAYQQAATGAPARSYIATARAALQRSQPGARILSTPVPASVLNPAFFGSASSTEAVLGPLARPGRPVRWIGTAAGTITPMIFDGIGRLWPAIVVGPVSTAAPGKRGCWAIASSPVRIPLQHSLYRWPWTIQIWHSGSASVLNVQFGGVFHTVSVPAGAHDVFVPAVGAGGAVSISNAGPGSAGCVTHLTVGTMQASAFGQPVPAVQVPG